MKTTIPFTELPDRRMKVGETHYQYCGLSNTINVVFRGLPTEDDFHNVTTHYNLDRIVINLDICKFIISLQKGKIWLTQEYSFIDGIVSFLVPHNIDNDRIWVRTFDENIELIKKITDSNIMQLKQVLAFAERALK